MNRTYSPRILLLVLLLSSLWVLTPTSVSLAGESRQQARVIKVVDGDTIVVEIGFRREHVRLIGIDTPESKPNRHAEKQARDRNLDQKTILTMGNQAANHARALLPKKSTVHLEFDVEKRDQYNRLLAYVWLSNGTMANEEIVKAGYAYLLTVPPNVRYRQQLAAAFSEARRDQRGLWASPAASVRRNTHPHSEVAQKSPTVATPKRKW